jgi:hypothetical protein
MANPTQAQIDKFTTNTTRLDSFVNGGINDTVTLDSGTIKSLTGVIGELSAVNPRGNWSTATTYAQKDIVVESSVVYICVIAHTSGTFSTDLSSGYWGAYQIDPTNAVTLLNDLTVTGDLVVNGTTTQVDSTVTMLSDPIITLSKDTQTVNDGKDRGIEFKYYDTSEKLGFFGWDRSVNAFTFVPDATNGSEVISGSVGNAIFNTVTANLSGDVTGNVNGNVTGTILTASQTNITGVGALSAGSITNTFGNIDIGSSNLTATGTISLGATSFNDNNVTNIGDIQVDSISGDADTDTKINFLGSNILSIDTGGSERLRIDSSGNVGIGDSSPVTRFDVTSGNSSISAKFGRYNNHGLFLHSDGGSGNYNWRVTTQTVVDGGFEIAPSTSIGGTSWASPVLVVKQNQRVGVNLNSPSYALDVSGSIGYSGSLVSTSDKTLKKNIKKCPDDIFPKLLQIESKKFNFKNEEDQKEYFGFIAQDVEKLFPSLVQKRGDGTLTLSYVEMIPLLLQAIQELHKLIKPTGKINLG